MENFEFIELSYKKPKPTGKSLADRLANRFAKRRRAEWFDEKEEENALRILRTLKNVEITYARIQMEKDHYNREIRPTLET